MARPLLLLTAGHQNADGGNEYERVMNGNKVSAIMSAIDLSDPGFDVYCGTPDNGLRASALGLQAVVSAGIQGAIAKFGKYPDLFVELHSQGVQDTKVRGAFGIHPDAAGDVDVDARDRLIPILVNDFVQATGIPKWTDGVMSEKETGVGLDGHRLGVFYASAGLKATMTRVVFEQGAHTNPQDRTIMASMTFMGDQARAFIKSCQAWLRVESVANTPIPPDADLDWTDELTHVIPGNWSAIAFATRRKIELIQPSTLNMFAANRVSVKSKEVDTAAEFWIESVWISLASGRLFLRTRKGWFINAWDTDFAGI